MYSINEVSIAPLVPIPHMSHRVRQGNSFLLYRPTGAEAVCAKNEVHCPCGTKQDFFKLFIIYASGKTKIRGKKRRMKLFDRLYL